RAEIAAVLSRLGIGDLGERHIRELSGGQQQRVFMARALLGRPELLLLDDLNATGSRSSSRPTTSTASPPICRGSRASTAR
ncbi:MAG TPA: ATP-binding cassette domain-containing protein, partial [Miltoncostaeaceae bacterium]|nr:ATP-binding cassette domain-containing protein [Miltoncostaeaceae bacterium]